MFGHGRIDGTLLIIGFVNFIAYWLAWYFAMGGK